MRKHTEASVFDNRYQRRWEGEREREREREEDGGRQCRDREK